jgi:aminomethyltransferase
MGQIEIAGDGALAAVQWLSSNDASRLSIGQAQYSALLTERGTFVDDILVYRLLEDHFLLVVNAGTIVQDYEWIARQTRERGSDAAGVYTSSRSALLALQGPRALDVLQNLTAIDLSGIRYYWFAVGEVAGIRATVSRTGYTGEDGFEVFIPPAQADRLWDAILAAGRDAGVKPCGLGARDTLRLEAAMRLCGSDMDDQTTALEAGLGWIVGWTKEDFLGAEALRAQKTRGLDRKLAAFEIKERGIARHGHPVMRGDEPVGVVTSGTQTPFLKKAIGFAMVPAAMSAVGSSFDIDIRGRRVRAEVVREPFYKRDKTSPGT